MAERTRLATAGAHAAVVGRLGKQPRGDVWLGRVFFTILLIAVGLALLGLVALIVQSMIKGSPAFSTDLFTEGPSRVNPEEAGFRPAIVGSLYAIGGVIILIVPLGVVVAAGSLTLALLVLPTVILAAREAIRAVPPSIREGSLALGATQWQTIRRQVLPASIPGIVTGVILAVSRALGEAAPLLLVGAATFVTADQPNPFEGGYSAMPVQIFNYALDPQDEFRTLAAAGVVVMLVVLLAMNSFAIWLRNRYEQQW
jgi:phosphate transport system permease protein